eukprot:486086_1
MFNRDCAIHCFKADIQNKRILPQCPECLAQKQTTFVAANAIELLYDQQLMELLQELQPHRDEQHRIEELNRKNTKTKQIGLIFVFGDVKKRVVLKNKPKKNVYEFTMDILRSKLSKRFASKGLKGNFVLKTDNGKVISRDE